MPLELSQWVSSLLSVEAADRPAAESALCEIYGAAGIPHPRYFFWFDSPFDAAWAVKLLKAPVDSLTQSIVESTSRTRTGREQLERVQGAMCESAQSNWSELSSTTGIYLRQNPRRPSLDM